MRQDLHRSERIEAIRALLKERSIRAQAEIVAHLRERGFEVGQSSVSRDLRDLGVAKVRGAYVLQPRGSATPVGSSPAQAGAALTLLPAMVRSVAAAGPYAVVVKTTVGGASPVGIAIDSAAWPEVVGTVAGDDTLLIATTGLRARQRIEERLLGLVGAAAGATRP